jgi:hypothetical protein
MLPATTPSSDIKPVRSNSGEAVDVASGTVPPALRFRCMQPSAKLSRHARRVLAQRLKSLWKTLKAHFAPQAADDVARAEERHRGRNEPPGGVGTGRDGLDPQRRTS